MATYTLAEVPEVTVSVRGKDSPIIRQKALDQIADMLESGELLTELPKELSIEQLVLTDSAKTTDTESDEEQPLEMALRELQKFLFLKLRTQRLKQSATVARQNMANLLSEETLEQDLDEAEETIKGHFKTLKDFVGVLREYRQSKPRAESALIVLDEALGFNLSTPDTLKTSNSTTKTKTSLDEDVSKIETKAELTDEAVRNGKKINS